jgi:hypothetical protein
MVKTKIEIKILAESLIADPRLTVDFKTLLDHARGQFQYHAGQRIRSIQYFFFAYAIFAAAYVGTFKVDNTHESPTLINCFICVMALVVSVGFWLLDQRNVQLVEIDEHALHDLEAIISARLDLDSFEMTERWDTASHRWIYRYSKVVNTLFAMFVLVSLLAFLQEAWSLWKPVGRNYQPFSASFLVCTSNEICFSAS